MALSSIAMKSGVTSYTVTGGTADTLYVRQQNINRATLGVTGDTAMLTAKSIVFSNSDPKPKTSAPNGMTQARRTLEIIQPKTLANTKLTNNGISVSLHVDPETTDTEVQALLDRLITALVDSNASTFFKRGSLS